MEKMETSNYKSQFMQDEFIDERIFHHKRNGFFIDIGANDGVTLNNTYYFEQFLDWNGICIEPIPEVFDTLNKNRRSKNINVCIGEEERFVNFVVFKEKHPKDKYWINMLSGIKEFFDDNYFESIKDVAVVDREMSLKMVPIKSILHEVTQEIDYISIDTEGAEYAVLKGIDFAKYFVHVISLEMNEKSFEDCRRLLKKNGFSLIKLLGRKEVIFINRHSKYFVGRLYVTLFSTQMKYYLITLKRFIFGNVKDQFLEYKIISSINDFLNKHLYKI